LDGWNGVSPAYSSTKNGSSKKWYKLGWEMLSFGPTLIEKEIHYRHDVREYVREIVITPLFLDM